jgi:hypothetical protein
LVGRDQPNILLDDRLAIRIRYTPGYYASWLQRNIDSINRFSVIQVYDLRRTTVSIATHQRWCESLELITARRYPSQLEATITIGGRFGSWLIAQSQIAG